MFAQLEWAGDRAEHSVLKETVAGKPLNERFGDVRGFRVEAGAMTIGATTTGDVIVGTIADARFSTAIALGGAEDTSSSPTDGTFKGFE